LAYKVYLEVHGEDVGMSVKCSGGSGSNGSGDKEGRGVLDMGEFSGKASGAAFSFLAFFRVANRFAPYFCSVEGLG
jgi:hypothetical protein